jgi:hypothetical protein
VPFPLHDVRFTSRRPAGGELSIYPRLLRDRAILPQVEVAIRSFEGLLGKERRELDAQALAHFFGDPKLARGIIACLARGYRYRARSFEELVGRTAWRRLRRAGLELPRALRCHLYDRVNDFGHGFLSRHERAERLGQLEAELALKPGELERLLYLDADEHAILVRVGPQPRPEDVVADYNLGLLLALLRHAELVELRLGHLDPAARATAEQLARAGGLDLELSGAAGEARLRLHGRADALGNWTRHGARLARLLVQLLLRLGRDAREGLARLRLRERVGTLRLGADLLELLCGGAAGDGWSDEPGWAPRELAESLAGPRPSRDGARVRRAIPPLARTSGVAAPDLLVSANGSAALVCAVGSAAQGARLARLAASGGSGEPLLFVGPESALAPLAAAGARTHPLAQPDLEAIIRAVADTQPAASAVRVA